MISIASAVCIRRSRFAVNVPPVPDAYRDVDTGRRPAPASFAGALSAAKPVAAVS